MTHHNPLKRTHFAPVHALALTIVSIMLILGAYTKLSNHADAVDLFDQLHLLSFMKAFGVIQLIILACLWWKPLRVMGTLIASAYFGAGVIMMLSLGENPLMATITLLLVWIIHKCNWWSMWTHGYHCACKSCSIGNSMLPRTRLCGCGKNGCACEHGKCSC